MKNLLKPLLFLFTLLIFNYVKGQSKWDTIPINYQSGFNIDHVVSTRWIQPVIGPMYEVEVFDDKYNFSLQSRFGYYQILDNNLQKGNMFIVQSAIIFNIHSRISIGTYWFNLQKNYPIDKLYPDEWVTVKDADYMGFAAPLSLFAKINVNSIIKTGFFSKSNIYFEGNYYRYYKRGASFKVIFTQQIHTTHKKK